MSEAEKTLDMVEQIRKLEEWERDQCSEVLTFAQAIRYVDAGTSSTE